MSNCTRRKLPLQNLALVRQSAPAERALVKQSSLLSRRGVLVEVQTGSQGVVPGDGPAFPRTLNMTREAGLELRTDIAPCSNWKLFQIEG